MRYSLTADHREFFLKNHHIELEEILSPAQIAALKMQAMQMFEHRMRIPGNKPFLAGYDLWRSSEAIKKIAHKKALALLASELFQTLPLRFGFDQYVHVDTKSVPPFAQTYTLQETSCLSPLAGALILPLEDLPAPLPFFPMPAKAGSGLFLSPSMPIPWPELYSTPGIHFFLISFAPDKTFFLADTRDPHAILLKKLGYVFNDLLKDSVHPVLLYRN